MTACEPTFAHLEPGERVELFAFAERSQAEIWAAPGQVAYAALISPPWIEIVGQKFQSMTENPYAVCAECGAQRHPAGRYCWLCGGALPEVVSPSKAAESEVRVAELASAGLADSQQRLLIWLGVIVVAVVGFGVAAAKDWAIAILFAVAVVPTLLVVLIGTSRARVKGTPWSPGKTAAVAATTAAGTVLTTIIVVVVVLAVAVLVAFAMIIALLEQCLQMLGGGGS